MNGSIMQWWAAKKKHRAGASPPSRPVRLMKLRVALMLLNSEWLKGLEGGLAPALFN